MFLFWEKTPEAAAHRRTGLFVTKVCFLQKHALFFRKKPPEAAAHRRTWLFVIKVCLLQNKCSFFEKKTTEAAAHRRTGLFVIKVSVLQKTYSLFEKKNAGGRRAPKNRAFCHKSAFVTKHVLFVWEKKTPEAAAHRRTGLFVIQVCVLQKKYSFLRKNNAGGRRAPKNRAFCHKSVCFAQRVLFFWEKSYVSGVI